MKLFFTFSVAKVVIIPETVVILGFKKFIRCIMG